MAERELRLLFLGPTVSFVAGGVLMLRLRLRRMLLVATLAVLLVPELRNLRRRGPVVADEPAVEAAV